MEEIKIVKDYCVTGKFDVDCSIKMDKDSEESKHLTLRFNMDRVDLVSIVTKALNSAKIQWQNGPGRAKFAHWTDRGVVDVNFSAPGKNVITREEKIQGLKIAFMKAGLDDIQSGELAKKSVDNPQVLSA